MKFIINTSFEPYFCALFDTHDGLIESKQWIDGRQSGQIVWDFVNNHDLKNKAVNFLGAVSGPGGFSHLRTSGVVINALSFYFDIPIHQARADKVITQFLQDQEKTGLNFALNSFGEGLFVVVDSELNRCSGIDEVQEKQLDQPDTWTGLVPDHKKHYFKNAVEVSLEDIETSTLKSLAAEIPTKTFVPDYEYPAVQA